MKKQNKLKVLIVFLLVMLSTSFVFAEETGWGSEEYARSQEEGYEEESDASFFSEEYLLHKYEIELENKTFQISRLLVFFIIFIIIILLFLLIKSLC